MPRSVVGKAACRGEAPKLSPRKDRPEFVFDRLTNGVCKMPGWKEVLEKEERMSVAAYVLARRFSP